MRSLRLAIAALVVALASPAGAALPQLALACSAAPAGQDASCTISRVSGGKGIYVLFQTSDGTAKAGVDYATVSRQVYLSAGTASLAIAVHTAVNPNAAGALKFNAAVAGGAAVVRATGSIVEPAPIPPPSPPPVPVVSEPVISPNGTKGEFDIADTFDVQTTLVPTVETVPASLDPVGAFRFTCLAGQLLKDDPIVYPGQPGKSHLHQFFGNMQTNASSTYQSLRTTGGSTCTRNASSTDPTPQRSAYWMPAMLDGAGNAVQPDMLLTYYKELPASDPACGSAPDATHIGYCIPIPNGLRFIQGYNAASGAGGPTDTTSMDMWKMGFDCYARGGDSLTGTKSTIAAIVATGLCPAGSWLRAFITFPDCWDGVHLDTADHRSHMAYGDGALIESFKRACPADHPYSIPEIALQIFFTTDANFVAGKWHLSSDEMVAGIAAGTTLHFDYWEAWSPVVKNLWQAGCINGHLSCNVGETGTGKSVSGMAQTPPWPNHVLVPLSSIP